MALLPYYRNRLYGGSLDFFDPWLDFDFYNPWLDYDFYTMPLSTLSRFRWITRPPRITYSTTTTTTTTTNNSNNSSENNNQVPARGPDTEKFCVQHNVDGFNPDSIKTRIEGRKLIVEAKHEDRQFGGDYNKRELRKTYELPEHADSSRMASYVTPNNILAIEVPIRKPEPVRPLAITTSDTRSVTSYSRTRAPMDYASYMRGSSFQSRTSERSESSKPLELTVALKNFEPSEMKVSVKDNQLIVQGEREQNDANRSERSYYYQTTTLPPGTRVDQLQARLSNGSQLKIDGPFST